MKQRNGQKGSEESEEQGKLSVGMGLFISVNKIPPMS